MNTKFPDVVRLDTAKDKFGIEYIVKCGEDNDDEDVDNDCVLDIVTVTDHLTGPEDKVQVYVSGCFSGTSRVGPNVAYYLIEYLASNFKKDPHITYLLQHREIIITPMTNALGYYANEEKEQTRVSETSKRSIWREPHHDFPYGQEAIRCLNTVVGRTLYRLFVENLFVTSLSFDASNFGANSITYPWGDDFYEIFVDGTTRSAEPPDYVAFD